MATEDLKQAQKDLKKQLEEGKITQKQYDAGFADNERQILSNANAIRTLQNEIKANIKFKNK